MNFQIVALHDGKMVNAIPYDENENSLGYEFNAKEDAQKAIEMAAFFRIREINPNGKFRKNDKKFTILEVY